MPKSISHQKRLRGCEGDLSAFLDSACCLGDRLGCLLLQLPPSFAFDQAVVSRFLQQLRALHSGPVAFEPRHASWFSATASSVLRDHSVSRAAADPARTRRAALPGGDHSIEYTRLHGSPTMYYDAYSMTAIGRIRERLDRPSTATRERWCIFDNTALGHATDNALTIINSLSATRCGSQSTTKEHDRHLSGLSTRTV